MELVGAALGGHANARNAGILCAEIIGQNIQLAYCFEGRLTRRGRSVECARGPLSIDCKVRAITLEPEKLECAVAGTLRDVRVQVQERVDIPAVARQVDDFAAGNRVSNGLIGGV